jgi:hypothetical protein
VRAGTPEGERDGLGKDLSEMQALIREEAGQLKEARERSAEGAESLAQTLEEVRAEEQLVDVMLRMSTRQPVSEAELVQAGATYERMMAGGDAAEADRRGGSR